MKVSKCIYFQLIAVQFAKTSLRSTQVIITINRNDAKIGEKKKDLSETLWHTGTIAVSDILLVGYSAKTDLFAFKTVCTGDYHHSN